MTRPHSCDDLTGVRLDFEAPVMQAEPLDRYYGSGRRAGL